MAGQIVGFDIGSNQVKIAVITGGKVRKTVSAEIPEGLMNNGAITSLDAMADFLKATIKENGIAIRRAAFVIPERQVFTRTVTVPAMTEAQLAFNLPYEFQDYLTEEKNKYIFDYSMLEVITDENHQPTEMRLFACAALKSVINEYREMFRRAGFKLDVVVPTEWAYGNIVRRITKNTDDKNSAVGVLDLGHMGSYIHIYANGEHSSSRTIDLGGQDMDNFISDRSGVDIHIAHTYKLADYNNILESDEAKDIYERLEIEIMKAVNFYNYNNRESELTDLYVCGGGAAITPLMDTVGSRTNLNVHSAEDLMKGISEEKEPWLYVLAAGAGIKE